MVVDIPGVYYSLYDDFDYESKEFRKEKEDVLLLKALRILHEEKRLVIMLNEMARHHPELNFYAVLMNEEYISCNIEEDFIEDLEDYSKQELKQLVEFCGLKNNGNKARLIDKLVDYFEESLLNYDYFITLDGLEVLQANMNLAITIDYIDHFIYSELIEMAKDIPAEESEVVMEEFFMKHKAHAMKLKDTKYYLYTINKLSELRNHQGRYYDAMDIEMEYFILMTNPQLMSEDDLQIYDTYDEGNIKRLHYLIDKRNANTANFKRIWDATVNDEDKLNMSYDESKGILDKITTITGYISEIDEISFEILSRCCPVRRKIQ